MGAGLSRPEQDAVANTFQVEILFGYELVGYTEITLAGTIDRESGTIDVDGQIIPFG